MFKLLGKLNKTEKFYVAFSGGKDSVAFTHFVTVFLSKHLIAT